MLAKVNSGAVNAIDALPVKVEVDTTPPTADLPDPANGGPIMQSSLNSRGYIDVTFSDASGSGLDIGTMKVGGNTSGTSIAANIRPGPDLMFGTADDALLSLALQGSIGSLIVTGSLRGSGYPAESFGIVSHQGIGGVWVGGSKLTLPWLLGNILIQQSWR